MLLTVSISNREIQLGFVKEDSVLGTAAASHDTRRTSDEYACIFKELLSLKGFSPSDFTAAIGASVDPAVTDTVVRAVSDLLGVRMHILTAGTKTGLNILTDDPSQLGGDLVASAVGALSMYTPPMILVDFGVATTFSVIDRNGSFVGCSIAPGVTLSSEALINSAGLLSNVSQGAPKKCIGTNTGDSMQSGSVYGSAAMVDGMVERIETELGYSAAVIASGGKAADMIVPYCKRDLSRDDSLLLLGLARIYRRNLRKPKDK